MLILSIDCAGSGCGVCVWQDGQVLSQLSETMERGQDQRLMPMIQSALKQANKTFEDLDRIAVTTGPGSFTGIRIGLAAARGIGLASGKPVIGVDRFSIYREQFAGVGGNQLIVLNSRRKELYCKFYPATGAAHEAQMLPQEEALAFAKANAAKIFGDMNFEDGPILKQPECVTAATLAAKVDPQNVTYLPRPLYIRAPDVTMPKNLTGTRRLVINDAEALADLHAGCFMHGKWNAAQIESSLTLDTTQGWGVFENGKVLGFILCQIVPDQSEILTLCVEPAHRRKGIAAILVQSASKAAEGHLHLDVAADNHAALELYKKLGFKQSGHRAAYYKTKSGAVDAILLTLK